MTGSVTGTVRWVLRAEGLAILAAATLAYMRWGGDWQTFALYFLVPDLSMLGYLAGKRVGAIGYNLAHSLVCALACLGHGVFAGQPVFALAGLIWCAHIGFDRALGFGLKYAEGFRVTHLGLVGRGNSVSI